MLYMHDVWVNWFEREENGYNVHHFHEWSKKDSVVLLDTTVIVKVTMELFNYIENSLEPIPIEILNDTEGKSFLRKKTDRIKLKNAFVMSDGQNVLAVDCNNSEIAYKKSRLIPRQYQIALDIISDPSNQIYELHRKDDFTKEYSIISPEPSTMVGLTRREKRLKQILYLVLDEIKMLNNVEKLKYLYGEVSNSTKMPSNFEALLNDFLDKIAIGWKKEFEDALNVGIQGNEYLRNLYNEENNKALIES